MIITTKIATVRALLLSHIYSGDVAFTAASLIIVIAVADLAGYLAGRRAAPVARVTFVVVLALGAFSGTPVTLWLLVPLIASLLVYGTFLLAGRENRYRRWSATAVIALTILAVIEELPWVLDAPGPTDSYSRLIVVGDSLASGGFDESRRWIELLDERTQVELVDRSRPAQDVSGAATDLLQMEQTSGAMLLVIGGNDMLTATGSAEFGAGLERLVTLALERGHDPIFLMELPVLPGYWGYAAAQRRVAREYDLPLIPKRVLARILADPRNTSDGVHLTQRGHAQMAGELAKWLDL